MNSTNSKKEDFFRKQKLNLNTLKSSKEHSGVIMKGDSSMYNPKKKRGSREVEEKNTKQQRKNNIWTDIQKYDYKKEV